MQVSILQENLNKGLSITSRIISSKTILPILNNILISTEEGKLKLTATNLETGINIWLPAKKEKTGKFTVPAKDITEFISSLPAGKIELKKRQEKLQLVSGSYKAVFNGMSAAEFPNVPSLKDKTISSKNLKKFKIDVKEFINIVNGICFAAAIDETRPILTGVRLSCIGKKIQFVATDGYRLSLKKIKLDKEVNIPTLIIPAKTLVEVAKIIKGEGELKKNKKLQITIIKEVKQIIFSFNNIEVVARLIEGEFPDFTKIIPEKGNTRVFIDRESFDKAVKSSSIFARRSANIIKLKILTEGQLSSKEKSSTIGAGQAKLKVMANAPEIGENEIQLEVKVNGKETNIAFNYRFLQDFISSFDDELFILELSGSLKPGLFKIEKDPSFFHIIMPVRLQED